MMKANAREYYAKLYSQCAQQARELYKEYPLKKVMKMLQEDGHPEITQHYIRRMLLDQGVRIRCNARPRKPVRCFQVMMSDVQAKAFAKWTARFPGRSMAECAIEALMYAVREADRRETAKTKRKGMYATTSDVLEKEFG
jgi:hypothetical protein